LQVVKTVKIPVHYALTKRKLSILDKLTAKTTYGAWVWSNLFDKHRLKGSYSDRARFCEWVKEESKLPAGYGSMLLRHDIMDVEELSQTVCGLEPENAKRERQMA